MPPLFTIGIPTYNRAEFLRESLASALGQTFDDLEIIVSDNASTDETEEVVRQAGSRVRYHRNPTNLGAAANWAKLVELARGRYFSWLQDDDWLRNTYAEHACAELEETPNAVVYIAHAIISPSIRIMHRRHLLAMPIALDWCRGIPRVIDGKVLAPLSLMTNVGNPPVIAFRTEVLRSCIGLWNEDYLLFGERAISAATAAHGDVIVDPRIGGFFRDHAHQCYKRIYKQDPDVYRRHWLWMVDAMQLLMKSWNKDWQEALHRTLEECAEVYGEAWLKKSESWPVDRWLCEEVKAILSSVVLSSSIEHRCRHSKLSLAKEFTRDLTPPLLWRVVRRCVRLRH